MMKAQIKREPILRKAKVQAPTLFCSSTNHIAWMCVNPFCEYSSLMCGERSCETCEKTHLACCSIRLGQVTHIINELNNRQYYLTDKLNQAESVVLKFFNDESKPLDKKFIEPYISKYDFQIRQIFQKHNTHSITGKEAKELEQSLKQERKQLYQLVNIYSQKYIKEANKIMEQFLEVKQRIFDECMKQLQRGQKDKCREVNHRLEIDLSGESHEESFIPLNSIFFELKKNLSLMDQMTSQQARFLYTELQKPKECELLFKADEKGFKVQSFYNLLDISQIFVLLKTDLNHTIAGLTLRTWNSFAQLSGQVDQIDGNMLYSLNHFELCYPQEKQKLIFSYQKCHQGQGYDLCVGFEDCSDQQTKYDYCMPFGIQNKKAERTITDAKFSKFGGDPEKNIFKIVELEIYKLHYE